MYWLMWGNMRLERQLYVRETVQNNCVVMFTNTWAWPFLRNQNMWQDYENARKIFDDLGVKYRTVKINKEAHSSVLTWALNRKYGRGGGMFGSDMPKIVVDQKFIGGYEDLKKFPTKELKKMIRTCEIAQRERREAEAAD